MILHVSEFPNALGVKALVSGTSPEKAVETRDGRKTVSRILAVLFITNCTKCLMVFSESVRICGVG